MSNNITVIKNRGPLKKLEKIAEQHSSQIALNSSSLAEITHYKSVAAVTNTFTLDLSQGENFLIETLDANAKTIALANIPQDDNRLLSIAIRLKYTNAAAITYPTGITWQNATVPSFTAGKKYWILLQSADKGVTWLGSCVGAW